MYLTGCTNAVIESRLIEIGVGLMATPDTGYRPERFPHYRAWAADNGCFAAGDRFNPDRWINWLERCKPFTATCLFAVAPDVVGDAEATLERSRQWLPVIRSMGYPAAFVGQDGQEHLPVPWDEFDALFIGGSTAWKLSEPAYALVREAKARGKWCHQGRCNSLRRFRAAAVSGFDSADGTYIAYNPTELTERVAKWMQAANQPRLWEVA